MKKTYINPEIQFEQMDTILQLLAGSTTVVFSDDTLDGVTFSSRGDDFEEDDN